jgi:hypothetical protein
VDLTRRWLNVLGDQPGLPVANPRSPLSAPELSATALADLLAALPGRSVYPGGTGLALEAAEFSEREGSPGLRLAWNLGITAPATPELLSFLQARQVVLPGLIRLLTGHEEAHLQVGVDGQKTKLYAYRRPHPGVLVDLVSLVDGRHREDAAFACVDFEDAPLLKQYAEYPDAAALLGTERLAAEPGLLSLAAQLPSGLAAGPAAIVLSELQKRGTIVGHTLHVKVDRAPERLAELAGPELANRLSQRLRAARTLGLHLHPTYVSWGSRAGALTTRTAYYRLARPTT